MRRTWYPVCYKVSIVRIAQVSPLYESVPPETYGGTERVVSFLTEELVRAGHDVTLFASGDSRTAARLVPVTERSLRLDPDSIDSLAHHVLMLEMVDRERHASTSSTITSTTCTSRSAGARRCRT